MNHHRISGNPRSLHLGALPLLVSTGVLLVACGGGDSSGSGGSSTTTTTDTGGSSSTTTTSMTGGGGAGGAVMNPDPCDPVTNDCLDATKCTITVDADKFGDAACEAPLGDKQVGDDCERLDGQLGHDTCAGGLLCTSFPKPLSNPQQRECVPMCDEAVACPGDQACIPVTTNPFGICLQHCKPFDGSCGSDPTQACDVWSTVGGGLEFACGHTGPHKSFESCKFLDDCPADHACRGGLCQPYCDDSHLCAEPSDACNFFLDSKEVGDFGTCSHADNSCLGSVVLDPPMNASEMVTLVVVDVVLGNTIGGATIKVCAANDAMCASPLGQTTSDAGGNATVGVPTTGAGFDGYFEVTAPGFLPEIVTTSRPIAGPGIGLYAQLGTKEGFESAFVGSPVADLSRGILFGVALDCAGMLQGGAVFSLDAADASTVFGHALPRFSAATLLPDVIDPVLTSSQAGGFMALNVPVGNVHVSEQTLDGKPISNKDVPSRAGTVTFVVIDPTP